MRVVVFGLQNKQMIIVNLKGGLGNQLFQYATGRALSLRNNDKLKLDVTGYAEHNGIDTLRQYSLSHFDIKAEIAKPEEIKKLKYPFGIISKGLRYFRAKILRQFNVNFVPSIFNRKGSFYLDGFFQTEKYFVDRQNEIRNDIVLKTPFSGNALEISNVIKNAKGSVSLHVRRGDYALDPRTNQYWGTCGPEYYTKALEYISSRIGKDIHVFVFSDGIDWVKEHIPVKYPVTYVSNPEIKDYEELVLMSQCNHHIIANSSFSWWGAWLNQKSDKIVVSPSVWARKDTELYKDIIPSTWIRM